MLDGTSTAAASRPLRVGIMTDGLKERIDGTEPAVANGGVGVYIHRLVGALQASGSANQYFLIRCGRGLLDIYRYAPANNVFLPGWHPVKLLGRFDVPHARLADRLRLDVLHYPNQFGGALLPRRIKRVVTLHDLTPLLFPRHHPWYRVLDYRLLLRRGLRLADQILVPSDYTRRDLITRGLATAQQITVVPEAAAADGHSASNSPASLSRYALPPRYVLSVGVLEPRKNHGLLVAALRYLHRDGERIGLVIAGRDGWRWSDPLADPAVADMRPFVRVLRNVPDAELVALYRGAAVFAYPSLYEGFGLPVLEAMACGTAAVAANASALPEVAGGAALLADPLDAGDFAAKIRLILRDTAVRQRLVAAGRARAALFSWQHTARHTLSVYAHVCGRSPDADGTSGAHVRPFLLTGCVASKSAS